jgi:hypothetical protein
MCPLERGGGGEGGGGGGGALVDLDKAFDTLAFPRRGLFREVFRFPTLRMCETRCTTSMKKIL